MYTLTCPGEDQRVMFNSRSLTSYSIREKLVLLDLRVARVLRVLVVRTVCRVSRERWACQDPPVYPALLESREPL